MGNREIPDDAIEIVAQFINDRNNKNYSIPVIGNPNNLETPQIFEIIPFNEIDNSTRHFYAVDGSSNSEQFYNGLSLAIYTAGYVCYYEGVQLSLNGNGDPIVLGQAYYPNNVLITTESHLLDIYDELLSLSPVQRLISYWGNLPESIFAYERETVCRDLNTVLSFCQEILEWAMIYEIANLEETKAGDVILRDGTLRSLQIKQEYLVQLGWYLHQKGINIIGITKQSPIKMELGYTFRQIDNYLQNQLKFTYPFKQSNPKQQKLCCWFEVSEAVLLNSYGKGSMYAKKAVKGGRGFGLFHVARLDYVEKLQNYDWLVVDINIFDAIPNIANDQFDRQPEKMREIFKELTRLTQEHYILGYPYPLVEAHNFVSLKRDFKDEIINRVKLSLYKDQRMDHIDIENLFLDIHDRF
jgi:hypothetical protein